MLSDSSSRALATIFAEHTVTVENVARDWCAEVKIHGTIEDVHLYAWLWLRRYHAIDYQPRAQLNNGNWHTVGLLNPRDDTLTMSVQVEYKTLFDFAKIA